MKNTILCFADCHIEPHQNLDRFNWLGKFIVDHKPDTIINLGDYVSLISISNWDTGKKLKLEGRRYAEDVAIGRTSTLILFNELQKLNDKQRRNKEKIYKPRTIFMEGNHEERLARYIEQNAELEGALNLHNDLITDEFYTEIYAYRSRLTIDNINFMHAPLSGNNQPLSGLHIPYKALSRFNNSIVCGHYHRFDISPGRRTDSNITQKAVICPIFSEERPSYLDENSPAVIDPGILLLTTFDSGNFSVNFISMEELKYDYS